MDGKRFDSLTKRLEAGLDSRRGLLTAIFAGLGVAGGAGEATAASPCGNGSVKANTCRRKNQCCTRLCDRRKERCFCRKEGQPCKQNRNCCRRGGRRLGCFRGRCRPVGCGTG